MKQSPPPSKISSSAVTSRLESGELRIWHPPLVHAWQIDAYGDHRNLELREMEPVPLPHGHVRITMEASGMNFPDLLMQAELRSGESLVVTGVAGALGSATVQLGRALGAQVIAVVGTEAKGAFAHENGAHDVVIRGKDDLRPALRALARRGVDVAVDVVGGAGFEDLARAMAWNGRLLALGFAGGTIQSLRTTWCCEKIGCGGRERRPRRRARSRRLLGDVSPGHEPVRPWQAASPSDGDPIWPGRGRFRRDPGAPSVRKVCF